MAFKTRHSLTDIAKLMKKNVIEVCKGNIIHWGKVTIVNVE